MHNSLKNLQGTTIDRQKPEAQYRILTVAVLFLADSQGLRTQDLATAELRTYIPTRSDRQSAVPLSSSQSI